MKTCCSCKQEKELTEYYKSNVRYYQRECKACTKTRQNAWYKTPEGKASATRSKLKARFGLTVEAYQEMSKQQDHVCAICGTDISYLGHKLSVDHDHQTGKIRGLLCKACNLGLGNFSDNTTYLQNAIKYLEESRK